MSSASEDAYEPSLLRTSPIRLTYGNTGFKATPENCRGWSQKAKDKGLAVDHLTSSTPNKPGGQHPSKGSINGQSERSNLLFALGRSIPSNY